MRRWPPSFAWTSEKLPEAQDCAACNNGITAGICGWRNGIPASVCTAAILSRPCPLWVKSRHRGYLNECPLYPQKQTSEPSRAMSALCQKRTFCAAVEALLFDYFVSCCE